MTREEAITNIEYLEWALDLTDEHHKALDMAIEALSAERLYTHEEVWKDDDLISRADAIAYIDRVINSGLGKSKSLDYICKYISALPSADRPSVVRCKDCRFWKNEHLCLVMSRYGSIDTKAEHYCSWGERREE